MRKPSPAPLLIDEHAVLVEQIAARQEHVRAGLQAGDWPRTELRQLLDYLHYELLDQTVHEERLLFPLAGGCADTRVQELVAEHLALRRATEQLADAAAPRNEGRDVDQLTALLRDLRRLLERHVVREERVLATVTLDGVETRRQPTWSRSWYPLTEGPVLDLDALPAPFAPPAALQRLARLAPGETVEVRSSSSLAALRTLTARRRAAEFTWVCLAEGPERWRARVTRRHAG